MGLETSWVVYIRDVHVSKSGQPDDGACINKLITLDSIIASHCNWYV